MVVPEAKRMVMAYQHTPLPVVVAALVAVGLAIQVTARGVALNAAELVAAAVADIPALPLWSQAMTVAIRGSTPA